VQVCPTGIDIRDGLQYQCIGCAACIDVCDDVMEKMGYENGLVKYTTENALSGKHVRLMRPRVILYSLLLLLLTAGLIYGIATRVPLEVNIIRDRNALFNTTNEGLIENVYTLKVINMDQEPRTFDISVSGIDEMKLLGETEAIRVDSGAVKDVLVRVHADPANLKTRSSEIEFHVEARDNPEAQTSENGRFLGPVL
jgi:cytochrome c oxidase accessory protein FixG